MINNTNYSLLFKIKINLNFFKRWAKQTLGKMNRYSKLSIQFLKDEQCFDSNFCDKKKLEILKPQFPNQAKLQWIGIRGIDDLNSFKN